MGNGPGAPGYANYNVIKEKYYMKYVICHQGRNQDLNLVEQKYEILTGHKNHC